MSSDIDRGVRIADKYEIVGPLGQGAYGSVYEAIQHPVERKVALKVISPHAAADEALRARFFREARAIARLNHPGVVTLHDYGDSNGMLYMVMEYVDGVELKAVVKAEAPLEPVRALDYIRQVVLVLVEAHGLDLIHRDLKPANIMIVKDAAGVERVKILDFGIAKLLDDRRARFQTQMGTVVGSPSYFSPEQAMGEPCGPAADQYSVGVILYEMVTGRKPFVGNSLMSLINAHRFESMPPLPAELDLPPAMTAFLRRALEKQPADRFPDARAMLEGLDTLIRNIVGEASGQWPIVESGLHRLPERRKKNTAPLPGLEADEAHQSSESLASVAATTPDPIPGIQPREGVGHARDMAAAQKAGIDQTAALIALGSAHDLYNQDPGITAPDPPPASEDEPAALPGVEVFNASSTIIKPPPPKTPRSPLQIALLVGGTIVVLGLVGMWLLSRGRTAADADVGAVVAADAELDEQPEEIEPVDAAPDAAPLDAAPAAAPDGAAAGDSATDALPDVSPDAAVDATVDAAPRRRTRTRRSRPRPPAPEKLQDPYQKL